MSRPILLFMLISCVLSDAATSQTPAEFRRPWPTGAQSGLFSRSIVGEFTGDAMLDAVVLRGARPSLIVGPRFYGLVIGLGAADDIYDVATLPNAGTGAGTDAILSVGMLGLCAWNLAPGSEPAEFLPTILAGGDWLGSQRLQVGDFDGSGYDDVAALDADLRTVRLLLDVGVAPVSGATITASASVRSMAAADQDADGVAELLLGTDAGIETHRIDDQTGGTSFVTQSIARLAVLRKSSGDRIVFLTPAGAGPAQFLVNGGEAGAAGPPLSLGSTLRATGLATYDADLDGDDEAWVTHQFSHEGVRFENRTIPGPPPGGGTFAFTDVEFVPLHDPASEPNLTSIADPVTADFDGDGDEDVLFPLELHDEVLLLQGDAVAEDDFAFTNFEALVVEVGEDEYALNFGADVPTGVSPSFLSTRSIEAVFFRRPMGADAEPDAMARYVFPVPTGVSYFGVTVPLGGSDAVSPTPEYWILLRLVDIDAGGDVVHGYPPSGCLVLSTTLSTEGIGDPSGVRGVNPTPDFPIFCDPPRPGPPTPPPPPGP